MIEFFIAKKQMFERKKQSILSIVGVFIGITVLIVSLGMFVSTLAFTADTMLVQAKIGIFSASIMGGIIGFLLLRRA